MLYAGKASTSQAAPKSKKLDGLLRNAVLAVAFGLLLVFTLQDYLALKAAAQSEAEIKAGAVATYLASELPRALSQGLKKPVVDVLRLKLDEPLVQSILVRDEAGRLFAGFSMGLNGEAMLYDESAPKAAQDKQISRTAMFLGAQGGAWTVQVKAKDFELGALELRRLGFMALRTFLLEAALLLAVYYCLNFSIYRVELGGALNGEREEQEAQAPLLPRSGRAYYSPGDAGGEVPEKSLAYAGLGAPRGSSGLYRESGRVLGPILPRSRRTSDRL